MKRAKNRNGAVINLTEALKPRTKDDGMLHALAPVDAVASNATPAGTFGAAFDGAAFLGASTCSKWAILTSCACPFWIEEARWSLTR